VQENAAWLCAARSMNQTFTGRIGVIKIPAEWIKLPPLPTVASAALEQSP
jgi:hypothetical protein